MEKSLEELAHYVGGERVGENVLIKGVIGLSQARSGYLTFCDDPALLSKAMATEAAAVIVPSDVTDFSIPHIRIRNPRLAFARILELFHPKKVHKPGIHPSAVLGNDLGPWKRSIHWSTCSGRRSGASGRSGYHISACLYR